MNITETCPCGASFDVTADSGEAVQAALGWRNTHLHEVMLEPAFDEEEADD